MTTILISVAIIAILLAFTLGRWSKSIDINRQLHDIEVEGVAVAGIDDVCRVISRLDNQKQGLITELNQLRNSNNAYQKNIEQLKDDYYKVMSQLRDKREKCEAQETFISQQGDSNKALVARINKCADKFDEWMQKLWEFASAINNNACEHRDNIGEYIFLMKRTRHKLIYATELLNKSHLLSIGKVEVQKNGSLKYSEGSRSLGNYENKENWAWTNDLNPLRVLPQMNPRESRPIALITDYKDYQNLLKKFGEVSKSSVNDITESAKMLDYMQEIKKEFPNILYNKK